MTENLHIAGADGAPADIDAELRAFEEAERERLGLRTARRQWVDTMTNADMSRKERDHVTLLISGLTAAQDFLAEGAMRGVGYHVKQIGMPDASGLQLGKEFGNRGQCNPTYFTVGNLVKYLIDLRDGQGMSTREIIDKYIFLTAGACGPCRFGMYVTEYRKALRDAGFDGFRVMLFQQQGGLSQATGEEAGLDLNPAFFINLLKALMAGDVINALGYRIRPYEVRPGATNEAIEEAKRIVYRALHQRTNILLALDKCRKLFRAIEVDRLRARPKVAIIGEFWAMTTEGDGNYHLQKFIEQEGGENDIQLTTAWLLYNIWEVARDTRVRADLRGTDTGKASLHGMDDLAVPKRLAAMRVADRGLRVVFQAMAHAAGLRGYHLSDMDEVADVASGYYSNDLRGGEGHMEVGKLILNVARAKAHMTLSVKPFGCMPSSGVSDGVQTLVQSRFPGTIYCAVETSGDGATNFYSRVQMYLFKARIAAEEELQRAYQEVGVTEAEVRAFLMDHPRYASPLYQPPHHEATAGTAANLVRTVAPLIRLSRTERLQLGAARVARATAALAEAVPAVAERVREIAADPGTRARVRADWEVVRDLVRGKAKERFGPIVDRAMGRVTAGATVH